MCLSQNLENLVLVYERVEIGSMYDYIHTQVRLVYKLYNTLLPAIPMQSAVYSVQRMRWDCCNLVDNLTCM
jgi:hypothetical protein